MSFSISMEEMLACSKSRRLAEEMAALSPFDDLHHAISVARDIWFNKVDVSDCLESLSGHPEIGDDPKEMTQRNKEEQSAAMATSSDSLLQEFLEWNARYKEKFGFIFLTCAFGRGMAEILAELKKRYQNRPMFEFEIAAQEEIKITELRLEKLLTDKTPAEIGQSYILPVKPRGDAERRSRPPITTHVLDVSRGCPASGIEVQLEMWKGSGRSPSFNGRDSGEWVFQGSSVTNSDGRSGHLMDIVDIILPGFYRLSFNTGRYIPSGFFPYVSIIFEIKETQRSEHFHVPLLFSPFSFTTYRGS